MPVYVYRGPEADIGCFRLWFSISLLEVASLAVPWAHRPALSQANKPQCPPVSAFPPPGYRLISSYLAFSCSGGDPNSGSLADEWVLYPLSHLPSL